jgi:putative ABC transport system permease protein
VRARALDPRVGVDVGTIDDLLDATLGPRLLTTSLLSGFAALAAVLAALGIYGTLSYAVAQRTRELAIRAALGASRARLFGLVLRGGAIVVGAGAGGLVAAVLLTRTMATMLVDIRPRDLLSFAGALAVLMLAALAAVVIPAVRATRLPPALALQAD